MAKEMNCEELKFYFESLETQEFDTSKFFSKQNFLYDALFYKLPTMK